MHNPLLGEHWFLVGYVGVPLNKKDYVFFVSKEDLIFVTNKDFAMWNSK